MKLQLNKHMMLRVIRDLILRPWRRKSCTTRCSAVWRRNHKQFLWARSQEMEKSIKGLHNCWVQKERENNSELSLLGVVAVQTKQNQGEG